MLTQNLMSFVVYYHVLTLHGQTKTYKGLYMLQRGSCTTIEDKVATKVLRLEPLYML
jgi:hypothetical protein